MVADLHVRVHKLQGKLKGQMSKSRWSKCWLYDPTVEVPRTTRWWCNIEFSDPASDEEIDDIRSEFSSEVYEDLGKNTSPFKKRKLLDECLQNKNSDGQSFYNNDSPTTVGGQLLNCSQVDREFAEFGRVEDKTVNCEGESEAFHNKLIYNSCLNFSFWKICPGLPSNL